MRTANVSDSETTAKIGAHWNAVDKFLTTGDSSALSAFRNVSIRAEGRRFALLTDTTIIETLANAGEVSFEDLYPTNDLSI